MSDRKTRKEVQAQLDRLNSVAGTDYTMDHGPGGFAVTTGRMERRRPAKEMYWTLDFAIDMIERMKRDDDPERLDRFAETIALYREGFEDVAERSLLRDDERFIEPHVIRLHEDHEADIDGIEHTYECDRCGAKLISEGSWGDIAERGECATEDGGVLCPKCFGENPTVGLLYEEGE